MKLPASGEDRVIVGWTLLVLLGVIAIEVVNAREWTHYAGGDNGESQGMAVVLLFAGFCVWCAGLVVAWAVLWLLGRRTSSPLP